jgi:hypothetical protein
MRKTYRILLMISLASALVAGISQLSAAQTITTGTLAGAVMDQQKAVLQGATVVAVHVPTGTTYEAVTQANGQYLMPAVRVGGPYTIKASMPKFKTQEQPDIQVNLGETRQVDFLLQLEGGTETVTVVADAIIIDTTRAGTAASIPAQTIEGLPTISRSINDFARTSPYFNTNPDSAGGSDMISVAGRNNRYNNMQIDGAVNNDVFGLASTGTPGGQTGTQPVSLDAIQEIQLVVSPYDVRQGGFSGGGINAVTKSGTNDYHGTGYFYGRNQDWIRGIPAVITAAAPSGATTWVGPFSDKQYGFSFGGPIVKNKVFFFSNFDWARKSTPSGYSLDGTSGQTWGTPSYVQQVIDVAKNIYKFDPGSMNEFSKPNNSNKYFGRGDFNLSSRHQLTARVNYVDGLAHIGTIYSNTYKMPDNFYRIQDKLLSTVVQLNSTIGKAFNEFRFTYQRERNVRGDQEAFKAFPEVRVYLPDGNSVYLGTEYSSHANKLNQNVAEITDDLTFVMENHTISIGMHDEFYKFYNLFIQNLYGSYQFSGVANFQAGIAQSYNHNFSNTSDPLQGAEFPVHQWGFYAGDKWRVRSNFMLTYGVRVDLPRFPETPHANPVPVKDFGYRTDIVPEPSMWSPRVGFNWDMSGSGSRRYQLRGGLGMFTGRTPYVWLSNQYGNTGVDFTSLSVSYNVNNAIPFVADANNQPITVTGGTTGRQTINVIDPDYQYPTILRSNLAVDHDLHLFDLIGTAELVYTKNIKEILYQNLNYVAGGNLPDGRTTFKKYDSTLNDVMLFTNTSSGKSWSISYKVERQFRNRLYVSSSYLYNRAYSKNDGTSSVARSNWANNPSSNSPNIPPTTRSNYDVGHRFNVTATVPIRLFMGVRSSASIFYNGQSGRPYSLGFNGDANSDGVTNNDLLFIPASSDQIMVYSSTSGQTATYNQLYTFLNNQGATYYSGIIPRNALRAKWMNSMDFRYGITVPTGWKTRAEVTIDVFNFLNLLNPDWGWQYFGAFPSSNVIGYGGIDSATGKVKYNLNTINSSSFSGVFTRDDLRSRAQAQVGVRFSF